MSNVPIFNSILWYATAVGFAGAGCLIACLTGKMLLTKRDIPTVGIALLVFPACALLLAGGMQDIICGQWPSLGNPPSFLCHGSSI